MHMLELYLDQAALVRHAEAQGHNVPNDEDMGYATHAWLKAALGQHAPRVFRLMNQRNGHSRLLGYGEHGLATIRKHASQYADPLADSVCEWKRSASKSMADVNWQGGQVLGFEIRLCPVIRGKDGERDAFLASLPENNGKREHDRADVYAEWFGERLGDAARLNNVEMKAFRLTSAWRRNHAEHRGSRLIRPDVLLAGHLQITDPEGFAHLLLKGVGRHKAFGFGMLLLRPA